jgi:oxygen-independent coproporphyrinogen-3 oxidase
VPAVVDWARGAGFEQVSLDLIYGTPGETLSDWEASLDAALACAPDHMSAYSLIVEDGTAMSRRVRNGELPMPDDDDLADKYELADERFEAAGLSWYEVSNWARDKASRCRHNLLYWTGGDWWGVGPGAHSHVGGTRWWNVKHPAAYADRLQAGLSPAQGREVLDHETRRLERMLLELRLSDGLALDVLDDVGRKAVPDLVLRGLLAPSGAGSGPGRRLTLTRTGRLLADAVLRDLVP